MSENCVPDLMMFVQIFENSDQIRDHVREYVDVSTVKGRQFAELLELHLDFTKTVIGELNEFNLSIIEKIDKIANDKT